MVESDAGGQSAKGNPVRLRHKIIAYLGAWIVALFATDPTAGLWALAWMFPLGLAAFINPHTADAGGWGIFFVCICVYVVHGYFYLRSKNLRLTVLLYGILLILLICNVEGCRRMIGAH